MRTLAALSILLAAMRCTPDIAQQAHPRPVDARPAQSQVLESQDRDFLERAATGSNAEIKIGALVNGRALRPEVLAFGHMMVADHTAAKQQLAAIAAAKRISLPTSLGEHQAGFDHVADETLENFDRDFIKTMIEDHQQAVELFQSEAQNGTDPQLKAFAASTLPVIQSHLQRALALSAIAHLPPPDATEPPPASTVKTATSF